MRCDHTVPPNKKSQLALAFLLLASARKPGKTAAITASFLQQRERPVLQQERQRRRRLEQLQERQRRRQREQRPERRQQPERRALQERVPAQRREPGQVQVLLLFCRKRSERKRPAGRRSGASVSWYLRKRFQKMATKRSR
jgi:hypothetical protein